MIRQKVVKRAALSTLELQRKNLKDRRRFMFRETVVQNSQRAFVCRQFVNLGSSCRMDFTKIILAE